MAHAQQRAREVRADLAAACDEDEHLAGGRRAAGGRTSQDLTASVSTSIAFEVGQTVRRPSVA